jgi:hypothetical protein
MASAFPTLSERMDPTMSHDLIGQRLIELGLVEHVVPHEELERFAIHRSDSTF